MLPNVPHQEIQNREWKKTLPVVSRSPTDNFTAAKVIEVVSRDLLAPGTRWDSTTFLRVTF